MHSTDWPNGRGQDHVGKKTSKGIESAFTDTDKLVEKAHGAIIKLFETEGESAFREYEEKALLEALSTGGVVATGGGIVLREANRKALRSHQVIFLDTNSDSVIKRVNLLKRPLLRDNPERWDEIYKERLHLYKSLAQETLFTGNRPIKALLEELKAKVEIHGN